ncbi:C6 transcription factor [Penicillium brasilianum]|uniref:C6 transcription factor n=1 Tax=Penicillium brasilianum TaxID=104259 RepID=A0A1S9RA72_PENBI|nr:C6 transcription factor [Penicillium brasilianum]
MTGHQTGETDAENLYLLSLSKRTSHMRSPLPTRVRSACDRCRQHKSRVEPPPAFATLSGPARYVSERTFLVDHFRQANHGKHGKSRQASRIQRYQDDLPTETLEKQWPDAPQGPGSNAASPPLARSPETLPRDEEPEGSTGVHGIPSSLEYGEAESAIGIARRLCELGSQHIDEHATFAIPGCQTNGPNGTLLNQGTTSQRTPISLILGQKFPSMSLVYDLLEEYFYSVHWFSLAIYEPKLRRKLHSIADGYAYASQRPFLLLLAVMLGMAAWYRSRRGDTDPTDNEKDWEQLGADMMKVVESSLVEIMDQPSVTATQTCILFGSHHLYHGRPNLSFSLLGATIKMGHSIGLQRQILRGEPEDIEERKRVWWTIYTWDRFASITYGRPLGINDKDCNLQMPSDVLENPKFSSIGSTPDTPICYSTYQRDLNRLYLIASPALEAIFGSRTFGTSEQLAGDSYFTLVKHATKKLQEWRHCLPTHLSLDLKKDFMFNGQASSRAHALQALSLQLTYDNVLIVLHRPLLARQVNNLSTMNMNKQSPAEVAANSPAYPSITSAHSAGHSGSYFDTMVSGTRVTSSELWMNAAVRTSKITELPVLVRLASESHLVAFLAINLFHAAIALAVLAISEPLSDTAQDIKRTITRIYRVQDLIGKRSALSKQSTIVLKNVVTLLLRRESEAMLAPVTGTSDPVSYQTSSTGTDQHPLSIEDALRLPVDATLDSRHALAMNETSSDVNRLHRLNESLASLRHALGPGDDRLSAISHGGDFPRAHETVNQSGHPIGMWQPPAQDWNVAENVQTAGVNNFYDENMEGGLYWLWDMTWNGLNR